MHALHQPHDLRRAAAAAIAAAVLAIVLTLSIAGGLNDLSTSASAPTSHAVVHPSTISPQATHPFTHSPFTSPLTAPVRLPWAGIAERAALGESQNRI